MCSCDIGLLRAGGKGERARSPVGFVLVISDKIVTWPRSRTLAPYRVRLVLVLSSLPYQRWFIENGRMQI